VAVLTDPAGAGRESLKDVPVLVHDDPRAVLGAAAAEVYGNPSQRLKVLGVTGTSGKTTTTYMLEAGLAAAGLSTGLVGGVEMRIAGRRIESALTTPEAPDLQALFAVMLEQGVTHVPMEVSSHALALGRVGGTHYAAGHSPTCRRTTWTSTRTWRTTSARRRGCSTAAPTSRWSARTRRGASGW